MLERAEAPFSSQVPRVSEPGHARARKHPRVGVTGALVRGRAGPDLALPLVVPTNSRRESWDGRLAEDLFRSTAAANG